jgi:nitrite reductase/ring-hydroxylating ferredoxin subunit
MIGGSQVQFLCPASAVPLNGCKRHARGRAGALALFNLGGRFHALDDRCSHGDASLADGDIDDGVIYCPLHAGGFDIASGEPVHPPCDEPVRAYTIIERDGGLWLESDPEH